MSRELTQTHALFERARRTMPRGVNSNFRYWSDRDTLVVTRGEGACIWDADENRYIDYRLGFGPIILGHAYPPVVDRVTRAIRDGTIFAWTTPLEIEVTERIARMTGLERVRLGNTGTEVTMHALRMARAYTGRERFIKFEGQYHGMYDYALFSIPSTPVGALGSRRSPVNVPASSGIPHGIGQYVINLPYNDLERLEEAVEAHWHELAAIMVEPLLGNAAAIMPRPGWLEKLRALCDRYGIVLIYDEVKTGFRIARGGAQEYFGVEADLVTYAKAMGNGFPVAALGGKATVMDLLEQGGVAQGGTYAGNAAGAAAASATLEVLEEQPVLEQIAQRGQTLMDGIDDILTRAGISHTMMGVGAIFGFALGVEEEPRDFRDYMRSDTALYEQLIMELVERGVLPDCDGCEPWFLCYNHGEEEIAETLEAFEEAVRSVK